MAAIAMGRKWRNDLISSADHEFEEALKRRKKMTRDLVDAVSDMRGHAKAAHDAAIAYMGEKNASKKELIALLSCTPAEAKMIFDDDAIAQFDAEADVDADDVVAAEDAADSSVDSDAGETGHAAAGSDEPGFTRDDSAGENGGSVQGMESSAPTGYSYSAGY